MIGKTPFGDEDPMKLFSNIRAGKIKFPFFFDSAAKSLIKHLVMVDLSKRYGNLINGTVLKKDSKILKDTNFLKT